MGIAQDRLAAFLPDYERDALVSREHPGAVLSLDDLHQPRRSCCDAANGASPHRQDDDRGPEVSLADVSTDLLRAALDDPTIIRGYPTATPWERWRRLAEFACLLDQIPAEQIPPSLRSRAARLRFLIWSIPARLTTSTDTTTIVADLALQHLGAIDRGITSDELYERARIARHDWLEHLAAADSDSWLSERRAHHPAGFDHEHRLLTEQHPTPPTPLTTRFRQLARRNTSPRPTRAPSRPLALATGSSTSGAVADHRETAARVSDLHWLAVGALLDAARAFGPDRRWVRALPWLLPALTLLVGTAFFIWPGPDAARWMAASVLAGQIVLATRLPAGWDALLLLRLPAAVAVGTAALLALTPRWWVAPHGWAIGAALAVAAALYLVLESRLHNVTTTAAFIRGIPVAIVAVCYAFLIALTALGYAAPAVAEHGQCLGGWWDHSPLDTRTLTVQCTKDLGLWPDGALGTVAAPAGAVFTLTGWSFAIGIAVQLLWDDQPVTAPLGRLRRRGGSA